MYKEDKMNIKKCIKCGAYVKVLEDCNCDECGIKCCGKNMVMLKAQESSDVDICVEMEPNLLRRSGLKIYLEDLLNCKVDVLRIHKNMDSYLTQQIKKDGILIFN